MGIGSIIGGWLSYVFGGFDIPILWLFGFCILDYLTGNFAVLKRGEWISKVAYKGVFKKLFIFVMVAVCHGVDESLGTDFVRTTCIFAYLINEVGSIVENIERMGYGDIIPSVLRNALKVLKEREQARMGGLTAPPPEENKQQTKVEEKK